MAVTAFPFWVLFVYLFEFLNFILLRGKPTAGLVMSFCVLFLPLLSFLLSANLAAFFSSPLLLQEPLVVALRQYLLTCL